MTIVSTIIEDAYRESNISSIGIPITADQLEEGLRLLRRLQLSALANEGGELYTNADLLDSFNDSSLQSNLRYYLRLTGNKTLFFPPNPDDGARISLVDMTQSPTVNVTLDGNGRAIDNLFNTTIPTLGLNSEWVYKAGGGNWIKTISLLVTDTWPYPTEFDDYFVIGLAMRLNPRNGAPIDPQSLETYRKLGVRFKARYKQGREVYPTQILNNYINGYFIDFETGH